MGPRGPWEDGCNVTVEMEAMEPVRKVLAHTARRLAAAEAVCEALLADPAWAEEGADLRNGVEHDSKLGDLLRTWERIKVQAP